MMIDENMLVSEILEVNPDLIEIFHKHGLNCMGCPGANMESLREAAEGHGANLKKLTEDLNLFLTDKQVE